MEPIYATSHLLSVVFVLTSFLSCFGARQENPIVKQLHHTHLYDPGAYQSHLSTSYRSDIVHNPRFPSFLDYKTRAPITRTSKASAPANSHKLVTVDDFGAKADGTDDSEAFKKAWNATCSSRERAVLVVPKNKTYHLKPVNFSGPCKSHLKVLIYGTIKASVKISDYENDRRHWLVVEKVKNLEVRGGGIINGNGRIWWVNSCKTNKTLPCKRAPTALTFLECKNLVVANLRFLNAQKMHLTFQGCVNVRALDLFVKAPRNSPNTDGIHVTGTKKIKISKCIIRTGDDCISIVSGSTRIEATDIICGPGHGISIGSLGANNSEAKVSHVEVNRATLSGTTNGLRIKTWQGGSGYAKKIRFQNVVMHNVTNPIIIDQYYCDQVDPCPEQPSAVKISQVMYRNIKGTSESEVAVKFNCSKRNPCRQILLQDIDLRREEINGSAKASCENVKLANMGHVSPMCA
ncbi:hypothetical protein Tsubulata_021409 [Turnera subulata]|uniref:endo-polygalacturonase n=1 Tax=Turnera subulata TaxID=218843 RepID=A0A9Q0G610_9ROSI|nr:hypothetical protein Tsubulata_021409 [Turnera subulata]